MCLDNIMLHGNMLSNSHFVVIQLFFLENSGPSLSECIVASLENSGPSHSECIVASLENSDFSLS